MSSKINVFLLPFAGGNKYSYRKYEESTPSFLKLIPLEYPGRGTRQNEPLITNMQLLVDDVFGQMKEKGFQKPYAIYGHSMGGLLCYLVTRKIIQKGERPPVHLFITGTSGPSENSREKKRHLLNKEDFLQEIKDLGGLPDPILQDSELMDYYEPIIRADFQLSELYVYEEQPPLDIPVTVITGREEKMSLGKIQAWQKEFVPKIDFKRFPGDHFFILDHIMPIMEIMARKLGNVNAIK
jgi:surfactin synthase thioesterase subunit